MNPRIEALKEYLAEDPQDHFSRYALALEYAKELRTNEAIQLLEDLISRDGNYLPVYYQLGKLHEANGNMNRAIEVYKRGVEIARQQKKLKTMNELQSALEQIE